MKRSYLITLSLSLILSYFSLAQQPDSYIAAWKRVDQLMQQRNLPKSALEEVQKIYTKAKKEGNDAQLLKALYYIGQVQQQTRENNESLAIGELEKEMLQLKEPALSLMQSMLAGLYWQYFQNHRWQLYNRTATINFIKADISTWSIDDFHKRISTLYLASLTNKKLLQQTRLDVYEPIVVKGNVRHLRPTLYDLLAHHALQYFSNDERDIRKPSYAFEIDQPEAFAPAAQFARIQFTTRDTASLYYKALLIYQDLIQFHLNDAQPDALIDADIARIEFVRRAAAMQNKDALYRQALETLISKWGNHPAAKQASFLLASYYHQKGATYQPLKDTSERYAIISAKEILERVVRDSSVKNEGWVNSYNLLQAITKPAFSFEVEKVNVPGQPFRSLIRYRNITQLNLRLIKADSSLKRRLQELHDDKNWSALTNTTAIRNWQQALPLTNDLQEHRVEIKIDALPIGEYILIATDDAGFNNRKSRIGAQLFHVSNISYIHQGHRFFVLHRESGQPLSNASVDLFTQEYNYNTSRYSRKKLGNYKADANGQFSIAPVKEERNYQLAIKHQDDYLDLNDQLYTYYYNERPGRETIDKQILFFTDRSLFRPGQTVFFKGIVINRIAKENKIVTGFKTTVYLRNANGERVDSLQVTTNDFGSFNGKFQLPQGVLNGQFTLETSRNVHGQATFAVEEYKRPKFYVGFDAIKETYKVNDVVTITGFAKAYAGNNVDKAKIVYRVVRQARFVYPWLSWRSWLPQAEPMEIANGVATTDKDGKFQIRFTAIPDNKIDTALDPVFDYRIYVDATDGSGETRSAENLVAAGYKSLLLKIALPETIESDSLRRISLRTENMNGSHQQAMVTLTMHVLIPEGRLLRKRYWEQPDLHVMSKQEYISNFPHDPYSNEDDYRNWQRGALVLQQTDSSRSNGEWSINNKNLVEGIYVLEFTTKDKEGKLVKDVRYLQVINPKTKQMGIPAYLLTTANTRNWQPGEKSSVQIGSSASNIFLIEEVDPSKENESKATYYFHSLTNEKKTFERVIKEDDRGGIGQHFFFVKHNRFYQSARIVQVPWSNKELDISFTTFRDKILPGSTERWEVKISGNKGQQLTAEMLAGMYDASLDQFQPHAWQKPAIWPVFNSNRPWQSQQNFAAIHSQDKWIHEAPFRSFEKRYDRFVFDHHYGGMDMQAAVRVTGRAASVSNTALESARAPMPAGAPKMEEMALDMKDASEVSQSSDGGKVNKGNVNEQAIQIRKNFNETAFFFPDLKTDAHGNIIFSFTAPEALTQWKLQTLAHTKEGAFGYAQQEIVTQKELMVRPNAPRFLRQGDRMELSVNIVNLSGKEFTGLAELQLVDAATNQSVDGWFQNIFPNQYFTVAAGSTETVKFPIEIPYTFNSALAWRVIARAGNISDGEEAAIPVLSNKMLVTETMPLPMRGTGTKRFSFEKLLASNSPTLQHHGLTVEYTTNPAWLAVQALPYLMSQGNQHAELIWNRYYANALAVKVANTTPRIRQLFETWKTKDTAALLSNLQKNEELKAVLLAETPWVLEAKNEAQQKQNIALLFDLVRMSSELKESLQQLMAMQSPNGGFVWLKGGPDDRYMTQYIVTGIGHLKKLNAIPKEQEGQLQSILRKALPYLDRKLKEEYDRQVKSKTNMKLVQPDELQVQYLYMRSFFPEISVAANTGPAYQYYRKQAQTYWMKRSQYNQGMIALALYRTGDSQTPANIIRSLKETAIVHEELGMYWKGNEYGRSWYWWHAPIETQALLIETFAEISKDDKAIDDMKTWLIKNKQTTNWRTTKATAEACYAMLLQGSDWLVNEPNVTINVGTSTISTSNNQGAEAGTGYFKKTIAPQFIKPEMGNITVNVKAPAAPATNAPSWGAVYWQYFEDMDKITSSATPLKLQKQLFIEKNTDRGPVLTPVQEGTPVKVGDKIKVRIELRVDRDMEYVHMKDMRSSSMEPVNVLSSYKWQGGLGYYESTKDASTDFFFSHLRKGTYVFEYPAFVTHAGNFTNGITTIQSMYAPEFTSHSEGVRLTVE